MGASWPRRAPLISSAPGVSGASLGVVRSPVVGCLQPGPGRGRMATLRGGVGLAREDGRSGRGAGLTAAGSDFFHLVFDYAKQETLGPLQSLGRFLLFGVVGSLVITAGVVLLLLALLRA